MKTYVLCGSARAGGYTSQAREIILSYAPEDEEIVVDKAINKKIRYCIACDKCLEHKGECIYNDDMTPIYEHLLTCDRLLIFAPVQFSALPAQLKTIIDRCQVFYNYKGLETKPKRAYVVLMGGAPKYKGQFEGAFNELTHVFKDINAEYAGKLSFFGTDAYGGHLPQRVIDELAEFAQLIFAPKQN